MKFATVCILSKSIVLLTCLSRSILIPFFPLYIKYLNLSLTQMGIIRSLQILTALVFTTLSIKTGKKLSNNTLKRISITGSIFTTITVCICLLFLPPYKFTKNVTHCVNNDDLDLQDLYNFHFKKSSNSVNQNSTNEFVTEKNYNGIFKDISRQHADVEESRIHNTIKINRTEANEIKESQSVNGQNVVDKTENAETNENSAIQKIREEFKKSNEHRTSNVIQNLNPYIDYGYSNEVLVKDTKKDEEQVIQKQKAKGSNSSKPKKLNTSSKFDTFVRTFNDHTLTSYYQNPSHNIADDTTDYIQENLDSAIEIKNKNIFKPIINKEEISLPVIKSQFNERNSDDLPDLNNINNENLISGTHILLGKHHNHNLDFNKQKNSNKHLLYRKNKHYSGLDVNTRQDKYRSATKELDDLFREKRDALQPAVTRDRKNDSSYNKVSSENASSLYREEIVNKHLFSLNDILQPETFLFALVLAVLYELFYSQIVPWTETFCYYNTDELNYDHLFASQIFLSKSFLWFISYFVVAVLTTIALCPYQIALHCFIAAVILVLAFLAALIFLSMDYSETKHFRSRKLSKPPPMERNLRESSLQRFFVSATNVLIGTSTACFTENILWNIETLSGFPYNYEYLYCGYYSINVLAFSAISKCLQYRNNNQQSTTSNADSDSDDEYTHFSYEWIRKNKEIIYVEEQKSNIITVSGTFLLSVTLAAVPFLTSAWMLLPLALLKGATDAFLEAVVPQGRWSSLVFGYGIGCFLGSAIADVFGMTGLFFSASCIALLCSFSWLCYSIFLRCFRRPYMRISLEGHSQESIQTERDMHNEEEEEDWLERAIKRDQFNQTQKQKIQQ